MKRFSKIVCAALIGVGIASTAMAGNVDTYGIGAKETSLAGAYAAWADDPMALYYNPAGLAQIDRPTLTVGFENIKPVLHANNYTVKDEYGNLLFPISNITDSSNALFVPNFGFAYPLIRGKLTVAAGSFVPFGLKISWNNSVKNPLAYNSYKSWYYRKVFAVGAGYKIFDNLYIGGAFEFGGSYSGSQRIDYATYRTTGVVVGVKGDLKDHRNYSWNVGIMYKPLNWMSLGLTYRSMTHTHFHGSIEVDSSNPDLVPNQKVNGKTSIDHPEQVQLGVKLKPFERLTLEIDYLWTRWDRISGYRVEFDRPLKKITPSGIKLVNSEYFPRSWNNTNVFKFGLEYRPSNLVSLRGGFYYDKTPVPTDTFDILWPDATKYMYTYGVGLKVSKNIKLDLDGFYGQSRGCRDVSGSSNLNDSYKAPGVNNPQVSLTAKGHLWGFGANVTYTF